MKMRKTLLVIAASLLLLTGNTSAGVVNKEMEKLMAEPGPSTSDPNRSSLRCWQYGKLLFEEMDWRGDSLTDKKDVLSFAHVSLRNQTLSLVDLGETVCLYRKVD